MTEKSDHVKNSENGIKKKSLVDKDDTEYSNEFTADEFINTNQLKHTANNNGHYINETQTMSQTTKALIILSWVCAALAGFVSIYFSIVGIISAYSAGRAVPGAGRAALIANIILAVINLVLSFVFLETVRNIFALL